MDYSTILLTVLAALIIYYFFFKPNNFFADRAIPFAPQRSALRNGLTFLFQGFSIAEVVEQLYKINEGAKYVGFFDFSRPTLLIRDPEVIKSVAVKNFDHFVNHRSVIDPKYEPLFGNNLVALRDQRWRDVRALLSPAFTSSKMKSMFKLMLNCGEDFTNFLADEAKQKPNDNVINSKDAFSCYTIDVIGTCAFGISVNSMKDPDNEFFVLGTKAMKFSGIKVGLKVLFIRAAPALAGRLGLHIFDSKVEQFFKNLVRETIETRDKKGITRPDMIQLMMETRGNKAEGAIHLSIEEMTSQAFIFFLAGFDSSSLLMSYAAHELAANPEVQARLRAEVDECLAQQPNGHVSYEAVNNLKYLDAVINEALRKHPVAPFLDRVCSKAFELPSTLPGSPPHVVQPGDHIWFPVFGLHRDPKYFPDPDEFRPERFLDDPQRSLHSPAYIPFGLGPRMCIGNRFALLEVKVLLLQLVAKCTFSLPPKMIHPIRYYKDGFSMKPQGGFWLDLKAR